MKSVLLLLLLPVSSWAAYDFTCNLHCYHGGECKHGKGKFGAYTETDESELLPWERESGVPPGVGMFCICPKGYTGLQCELAMKVCDQNTNSCFNGAACTKATDLDGKFWWHCECDYEKSVVDAKYASKFCQHISTLFCMKSSGDFGKEKQSYCTNGGKCKKPDHQGQKSVGCICQEGFEGSHCETYKKALTASAVVVEASKSPVVAIVVGLIVGLIFCATGALWFRERKEKKKNRRRRRLENAGIQTSESFRAKPDGEVI